MRNHKNNENVTSICLHNKMNGNCTLELYISPYARNAHRHRGWNAQNISCGYVYVCVCNT